MELSNPNDTGGPGHRPCTNLEAGRGPRENPVVTRLFRKRKIGLNEAGQSATDSQPEATKGKVSIFNHLEIGRPSASEAATVAEPAAQRFCHRFPCMVTPGFTGLCDYNSLAADGGVVKCDRELPGEARFWFLELPIPAIHRLSCPAENQCTALILRLTHPGCGVRSLRGDERLQE